MSFATVVKKENPTLQDIDSTKDPAVAIFSDGTTLDFPKGCKFEPDHVEDPNGKIIGRCLRVHQPLVDGKPGGPSFVIPQYCSVQNVKTAIERVEKGV